MFVWMRWCELFWVIYMVVGFVFLVLGLSILIEFVGMVLVILVVEILFIILVFCVWRFVILDSSCVILVVGLSMCEVDSLEIELRLF